MPKVLIVDDQSLVRNGLQRILNQETDIDVIGECSDGDQVVAKIDLLQPDIVLMDVRMKRVDGITATRAIKKLRTAPSVIMLTTFGDDDVLLSALSAGAAGFVLKDATPDNLLRAIRAVAGGGAWLDPAVTDTVIKHYRRQKQVRSASVTQSEPLTDREREVLIRIAEGLTNHEIADALFVSETTIKTHISHIFSKLGARDRAAAIVYAYEAGVVVPKRE